MSISAFSNPYITLGVSDEAAPDEIRLAYRRAISTCHPDHHRDDPNAAARFRELTSAYNALRDADSRLAVDAALGKRRSAKSWYESSPQGQAKATAKSAANGASSSPGSSQYARAATQLASRNLRAPEIAEQLINAQCPYETAWQLAWHSRDRFLDTRVQSVSGVRSKNAPMANLGRWRNPRNSRWLVFRQRISRLLSLD